MKIKGDFVTNSSSVSFMFGIEDISNKNPNSLFGYERKASQLKEHEKTIKNIESKGKQINSTEELVNWMKYEYGIDPHSTDPDMIEEFEDFREGFYEPSLKLIEEGGSVYYVTYDYDNQSMLEKCELIAKNKDGDGVWQIYCDH